MSRILHDATVIRVEDVTPKMRRITVMGDGLRQMDVDRPGQWMKVFFPTPNGARPQGRAYTIRAYNAEQGWLVLDFALHGDQGPAAYWSARARVGDALQLAGPRAGYWIDPAVTDHVLIGDATALPAIAGIVEQLGSGTRAHLFVEVADAAEEQSFATRSDVTIQWIHAGAAYPGTTGKLELVVQRTVLAKAPQVFLAGEAFMVRAIRTHLLVDHAIPPTSIHSAGYWRLGATDHRDSD